MSVSKLPQIVTKSQKTQLLPFSVSSWASPPPHSPVNSWHGIALPPLCLGDLMPRVTGVGCPHLWSEVTAGHFTSGATRVRRGGRPGHLCPAGSRVSSLRLGSRKPALAESRSLGGSYCSRFLHGQGHWASWPQGLDRMWEPQAKAPRGPGPAPPLIGQAFSPSAVLGRPSVQYRRGNRGTRRRVAGADGTDTPRLGVTARMLIGHR